ncbi:hypothetical protein AGABI2DRAFT_142081 [Agaricus bisporus var. bisporus H97]|uniref:hypothetical protein n=1 Tax=Agaricus bisporus var. bisporus (strain H97 / ATCC MYA-4626 / FGSC 10389) TaxID=936046 RepID=UPI00029F754C|nr:hypothetical protein AGABI2DRAFT_142081 [Agaricus bisporus var. bisporus H97]EKV49518.1 hypothetical protein AGABI2DRAFT_142081 [Agaricus bisporus var. bisporus H97]
MFAPACIQPYHGEYDHYRLNLGWNLQKIYYQLLLATSRQRLPSVNHQVYLQSQISTALSEPLLLQGTPACTNIKALLVMIAEVEITIRSMEDEKIRKNEAAQTWRDLAIPQPTELMNENCQRMGRTAVPIAHSATNRANSLPEVGGKSKYATTGRRNSYTKPRNNYKFLKTSSSCLGFLLIETWIYWRCRKTKGRSCIKGRCRSVVGSICYPASYSTSSGSWSSTQRTPNFRRYAELCKGHDYSFSLGF